MNLIKTFFYIIGREFKKFGKSSVAMLIFIGAPLTYGFLIGGVYSDAIVTDLPIAVVDLDDTPLSKKVIDALDDNQYLKVVEIKHIQGNMRDEVIAKNYQGVVIIPDRFEADIQQKRYPELDIDINAANMLNANYVSTGVQTVLGVLNAGIEIETIKKKGVPDAIAQKQFESFKVNMTRFFNPSSNYLIFLFPGMLGTIMQQVFLLGLALSFSREYDEKTFGELLGRTKSAFMLLFAKSIPYFIMGILVWFPLIYGMFHLFHIQMMESQLVFFGLTCLFFGCVTFLGVGISALLPNQLKATEVLMVVATPSFIISGQTWPLMQMPKCIQVMSSCVPLTHYAEAFRKLVEMNVGLKEIMPQIYSLLIILGVCFIMALGIIKLQIHKHSKNIAN